MKILNDKLKTFWKNFREFLASIICIPLVGITIIILLIAALITTLIEKLLQVNTGKSIIKFFRETIYETKKEIEQSTECNS